MTSTLSNLVNNLSGVIHRIKCKFEHNDKTLELVVVNIIIATDFFKNTNFKFDLIETKIINTNLTKS